MTDLKITHVSTKSRYIYSENIHAETYSLLLSSLVQDSKERTSLFNAMNEIPTIKAKADWTLKWIHDESSTFQTRLIAFAMVEGVFFSSSFASIFWLKKKGVMPGLCYSNELISRDEGLHTRFACLLLEHINDRPPIAVVHQMALEAVDLEKRFARGMC